MIKGQQIKRIGAYVSFGNAKLILHDDKDQMYLMEVDQIMKFNTDFNNLKFNVVKKRVYNYLEVKL